MQSVAAMALIQTSHPIHFLIGSPPLRGRLCTDRTGGNHQGNPLFNRGHGHLSFPPLVAETFSSSAKMVRHVELQKTCAQDPLFRGEGGPSGQSHPFRPGLFVWVNRAPRRLSWEGAPRGQGAEFHSRFALVAGHSIQGHPGAALGHPAKAAPAGRRHRLQAGPHRGLTRACLTTDGSGGAPV